MSKMPDFEIVNPTTPSHGGPDLGEHSHDHPHGHEHNHGHSHAPATFGLAFAIGILLNGGFVIGETIYGFLINSMALLADAGHNLFDVLGLLAAWLAIRLAKRAPSARFTYGMQGSTILAALFNGALLWIAVGAIGVEAVQRFWHPVEVPGFWVMVIAGIGIFTNGATALLFMRGRNAELNLRAAYLHMFADAVVAAGVVIAGLLIIETGWTWIDPLTSLLVAGAIIWSSWNLLREALAMSLNATPSHLKTEEVRQFLLSMKGVVNVHDLHIWSLSTTEVALSAHLFMPKGHPGGNFLNIVCAELRDHFDIGHATLQIETSNAGLCGKACDLQKVA
jgi:cobalt-zinc-cadmium efflux system protein